MFFPQFSSFLLLVAMGGQPNSVVLQKTPSFGTARVWRPRNAGSPSHRSATAPSRFIDRGPAPRHGGVQGRRREVGIRLKGAPS